jgi:uncharacterized protein (TIGR03435 family)
MTRPLLIIAIASSIFTIATAAQTTTAPTRPTFELASIRRNMDSDPGGNVRIDPGNRLFVTNISLAGLIRQAYGTQRWEMVPGGDLPSWMQTERWDIQAKGAPDATREQVNDMFRNLLADRFKLVAKRESRQIPVYALVRARTDGKLGRQLGPSTVDCQANQAACGIQDLRGNISMTGAEWTNFPRSLSLPAGRYIVDKTGITGRVDLRLTWTQDPATDPGGGQNEAPSLFTALQEQLGLRLEPTEAPVEVLVIYSAQRPNED